MQTQTQLEQDRLVEQKIQKVRELYADAPQMAKTALENGLRDSDESTLAAAIADGKRRPNRQPSGQGLGAHRDPPVRKGRSEAAARACCSCWNGNFDDADEVGTVHDMRFVFLDNDTKLLFATAYDGDWDPYIEDFATKIPDIMDIAFSDFEGWPGIHSPEVEGLDRQAPDHGRRLVRRQSESDGGGDPTA